MLDVAALATRLGPDAAGEVMTLQMAAWVVEARIALELDIPALWEDLATVRGALEDPDVTAWGVRDGGRLVGIVRTQVHDGVAHVGRLGVVPDRHGEGLGGDLLALAEARVPPSVVAFELFTGARSTANHRFYEKRGYVRVDGADGPPGTVTYRKARG